MSDFVINVTTSPPAQISIDGVEETLVLAGNGISPQDADERYVNITGDEAINGIKSFDQLPLHSGLPLEFIGNKIQSIDQSSSTGQYPSAKSVYDFVTGELGYVQDLKSAVSPSGDHLLVSGNIYASGNLLAQVVSPERTTVTGNGLTSVYAINGAGSLTNPSALIVAIDGAMQEPVVDYTVEAGFITFTSPLANGAKAVIVSPANTVQVSDFIPSDGSVTSEKLDTNLSLAGNLTINGTDSTMPNQLPLRASSLMTREQIQEEILWTPNIVQYYPINGTVLNGGLVNTIVGQSTGIQCGANAQSSARTTLAFDWQNSAASGGTMRFDKPFKVRIPVNFNMTNPDANGVVVGRIYIGSNGSFTLPFANSDAYPVQTRGLGVEWRKKSGNPTHECRLFARDGFIGSDGTFITSAWVDMGDIASGTNHFFDLLLTFNGTTLSLYVSYWNAGLVSNPPARQTIIPLITLSGIGVPINSASVATNWAKIEAVVIADGVTAPAASSSVNYFRQITVQQA